MAKKKTQIVLDADVIIHFSKGDRLALLPTILPEYEYIVLSKVYEEIGSIKKQLDNQIHFLKNIHLIDFSSLSAETIKEYALLSSTFGKGESACMAYCRYNHHVVGSNNTKDVTDYCIKHGITYLTTLDFLYLAYKRQLMTAEECSEFMKTVSSKGSNGVPIIDISMYTFNKTI